jgi:hypothetical protein
MSTPNTNPIMVRLANIGSARVSAANTARDGSGTIPTIFTAGADGSLVSSIQFTSAQAAAAANSAMVGRVFVTDNAGANPRLYKEVVIPTVTPSVTVIGAQVIITFPNGLHLMSGQLLKCCISVYAGAQDQMDVVAIGEDF